MGTRLSLTARAAAALASAAIVTACSGTGTTTAPPPASTRASTPAASPAACKLKTTFDYLVRTTEPDLAATAQEIGNVDFVNCTPFLQDFTRSEEHTSELQSPMYLV